MGAQCQGTGRGLLDRGIPAAERPRLGDLCRRIAANVCRGEHSRAAPERVGIGVWMNRRQRLIAVLVVVSSGAALWTVTVGLDGESLRTRLIGAFGAGLLGMVAVLIAARLWFRRPG